MNKTLVLLIVEYVGMFGLIGLLAFVPWTKMVLGGVLAVIGALFPKSSADEKEGSASLETGEPAPKLKLNFQGSLRVGLILSGVILICGSVWDGFATREAAKSDIKAKIEHAVALPKVAAADNAPSGSVAIDYSQVIGLCKAQIIPAKACTEIARTAYASSACDDECKQWSIAQQAVEILSKQKAGPAAAANTEPSAASH